MLRPTEELISIVMPVYNALPFLRRTLQSITEQTYQNWELLLIDDASSDGSTEFLKNWIARQKQNSEAFSEVTSKITSRTAPEMTSVTEPAKTTKATTDVTNATKVTTGRRIELYTNSENRGPAAARNIGIRNARGRYLVFLDADDYWKPDKLEKQYRFMKQKNCEFSFTGYEFADQNGTPNGKIVHVPESIIYKEALTNTTISTITVMLDRSHLPEALLLMPEDCKREDTATWWSILKEGYTAYGLDEALSVYCRHKGSHSSNKFKAVAGTYHMYRRQEGLSAFCSLRYLFLNLNKAIKRRV